MLVRLAKGRMMTVIRLEVIMQPRQKFFFDSFAGTVSYIFVLSK